MFVCNMQWLCDWNALECCVAQDFESAPPGKTGKIQSPPGNTSKLQESWRWRKFPRRNCPLANLSPPLYLHGVASCQNCQTPCFSYTCAFSASPLCSRPGLGACNMARISFVGSVRPLVHCISQVLCMDHQPNLVHGSPRLAEPGPLAMVLTPSGIQKVLAGTLRSGGGAGWGGSLVLANQQLLDSSASNALEKYFVGQKWSQQRGRHGCKSASGKLLWFMNFDLQLLWTSGRGCGGGNRAACADPSQRVVRRPRKRRRCNWNGRRRCKFASDGCCGGGHCDRCLFETPPVVSAMDSEILCKTRCFVVGGLEGRRAGPGRRGGSSEEKTCSKSIFGPWDAWFINQILV